LVNEKPNNVTEIQFQVVDKGYVTEKEFKKLSKSYKNIGTYASNNEDDFHIKILTFLLIWLFGWAPFFWSLVSISVPAKFRNCRTACNNMIMLF